ncbi:TRAP transporter substrate-binding protein [Methylobacterium isbiliense]|jgi:TRAP-type C4-dicarboxylate transport system substrate-binding protein|uniref:Solute-binding protein n=1 Tax=Methylobacterium isbiliense TaxID=315478 RepID=A0ABQ4SEV3_9HYPH|nr:TRAP transporter substrate-binding protein [Methylobacterium isbiliense]MDN3627482.1 TRAP transporter substrate-binding protein [Methylobacterium isbiliense]GJE01710.1 Solute-binding protein [Methylobacterium isbiliense]
MTLSRRHLLAAAAGAALPLAAPSVLRAQQTREFRLGLITPPNHPWNNAALKVGESLKQETSGRLSLTVFHAGQLGNEGAMMQQLQSGALDMAFIQAAELGSRVPAIAAINAPYVVRSTEAVAKLVRHPVALGLFDVLPRETGTIGLAWGITSIRAVFAARDIASLADLKGMKLRINPTPAFRDFYQLLGAAPTPIPTPQVYDAMANGQVDGLEADLDFSWNQRFDRVSKTVLRMNAVHMPMIALVSGRVWQGLPAADRDLVTRTTKAALDAEIDEIVANQPGIWANLAKQPVKIVVADVKDADPIIEAYDRIWLPKAPVLAELRKVGAALA